MHYDLKHLTQTSTEVFGPIQDDEALLLYSLVRVIGAKYIVEIGGLFGYSAQNFCKAIPDDGKVIIVDPNFGYKHSLPLHKHTLIKKLAHQVNISDLNIPRIDILFFDCHVLDSQMKFFDNVQPLLNQNTIIVLHDTGTRPINYGKDHYVSDTDGVYGNNGFFPISTEREMSNAFMELGYYPLQLHANNNDLPDYIKIRHGLTLLQKPIKLI